jgi:hypothetical protein
MGKPGRARARSSPARVRRTTGTETSQYREGREINRDAPSSGERKGRSPNQSACPAGVVGPADGPVEASRSPLERGAEDGESPVGDGEAAGLAVFLSSARPEKSGAKLGGPPSKAKGLPCDR